MVMGGPEAPDPGIALGVVGAFGQPEVGLPLAERRIRLPGARTVGHPSVGVHCLFSWSLRNATAPGPTKRHRYMGAAPTLARVLRRSRPDGEKQRPLVSAFRGTSASTLKWLKAEAKGL
jgi:hypothetical protein